jgi:hypothetical protein
MKDKVFRYCGIAVVLALLVTAHLDIFAANNVGYLYSEMNDVYTQMREALSQQEERKIDYGFCEINFSEIMIGNEIFAYECIDNSLQMIKLAFFPLFVNERLIAFALVDYNDKELVVTISAHFANDIAPIISINESIAIVYDQKGCYLLTDSEYIFIREYSYHVNERSMINKTTVHDAVSLVSLKPMNTLGYQNVSQSRNMKLLNVSVVLQPANSLICWAASSACIGNYKTGSSDTARQVAEWWYNPAPWNQSAPVATARSVLSLRYSLNYRAYTSTISEAQMLRNIDDDYPLYGNFNYGAPLNHHTVIRGINVISSSISIMDPEFGFTTATRNNNGQYRYIHPHGATTLTLVGYIPFSL